MAELVRTLPTLRQQADAVAASGPPPQMVLSGDSDALAGASLQEQVQEMAAHAGASLTSTEALPASAAGEYRRIGIRLSVSGAWPVLVRLLQSIEQATPRMLIDDVQLQGSPVHIQGLGLPLDASFTVLAFRHAAAPAPGGQPEPATGAVRTTP
jgi:general secretion pathway protein M